MFLGLFPEATYSSIRLPLEAGDCLFLYTDGILEFKNPAEEQFGGDRLRQFIEANHGLGADHLVEAVMSQLWRWSEQAPGVAQSDDITILAMDIKNH